MSSGLNKLPANVQRDVVHNYTITALGHAPRAL